MALHLLYNNEYIQSGIMESPPIGQDLRTPETWYDVPKLLSANIGCGEFTNETILECWQSVNWLYILYAEYNTSLIKNWYNMPYTPTVGTDTIPYQPVEAFTYPNISAQVPPFIVGANADESYAFLTTGVYFNYSLLYDRLVAIFGVDNTELTLGMFLMIYKLLISVIYGFIIYIFRFL